MSTMRKSNQTILDSQTVRFNISGGPSRDRIFDACKYLHDKIKIDLDFKVILGYSAPKDDPCCAAFEVPIKDFRVHKIMCMRTDQERVLCSPDVVKRILIRVCLL